MEIAFMPVLLRFLLRHVGSKATVENYKSS